MSGHPQVRVHILDMDSRRAYDETQTNDEILHGDVVVASDAVAVLFHAWPVTIAGPHGEFHTCNADGILADEPDLAPAFALAARLGSTLSRESDA